MAPLVCWGFEGSYLGTESRKAAPTHRGISRPVDTFLKHRFRRRFYAAASNPGRWWKRGRKAQSSYDTDESNPTAKLMLNLLVAFSEFERELIVERTRAGLARARREGRIGRRKRLVVDRERIRQLDELGYSTREIGEEMSISAASVCRLLKA